MDNDLYTPPHTQHWSAGRLAMQRYFIAVLESQKLWRLWEETNQRVAAENNATIAFLKEHGPVDIKFNNDGRRYQARLSPLGSPVIVHVGEEDM